MTRPIRRGRPWPPCNGVMTTFSTERGLARKIYRRLCRRWFATAKVWFGVKG